jgi:radical SAM-linked protein
MQRLRFEFKRGPELKYLSHLDLLRLWERAIRRAGVPLAYSEGFTPHPRLSLAAPLPVGMTAGAELADIWLSVWKPPAEVAERLRGSLPPGLGVVNVWPVALEEDSLQSRMDRAAYDVTGSWPHTPESLEKSIAALLAAASFPWTQKRGPEEHTYDLRAQVISLELVPSTGGQSQLRMVLTCNSRGAGRPEQVFLALGFPEPPLSIHRSALIFTPPN